LRIAILADIHGNLTALDAVLADLRHQKPDVIYHGGDLAFGGCNPAEVIDCIIQEGWQGVLGNTDEMLWDQRGTARAGIFRAAAKAIVQSALRFVWSGNKEDDRSITSGVATRIA
jgi:predicted phosphodiesterase